MKPLLRSLGLVAGGVAAAGAAGNLVLRRRVAREVRMLIRDARPPASDPIRLDALPDLPPPVRRYLAFAGVDGRTPIRVVRLRHGGEFRAGAELPWMPVRGEEYLTADPPAFVWRATMRPAPFLPVIGRDAYLHGRGNMLIRPLGFIPLANGSGNAFDQSAFARWVGETFWIPTALVPGRGVAWKAIDANTAELRVADGSIRVTAIVHFDGEGRLVRCEVDRYRAVGKRSVLTPFVGRAGRYVEVDGFRVPMEVEGAWRLETGELPYARFVVDHIEMDLARAF